MKLSKKRQNWSELNSMARAPLVAPEGTIWRRVLRTTSKSHQKHLGDYPGGPRGEVQGIFEAHEAPRDGTVGRESGFSGFVENRAFEAVNPSKQPVFNSETASGQPRFALGWLGEFLI